MKTEQIGVRVRTRSTRIEWTMVLAAGLWSLSILGCSDGAVRSDETRSDVSGTASEPAPSDTSMAETAAHGDDLFPPKSNGGEGAPSDGGGTSGITGGLRGLIQSMNVFEEAGVDEGLVQQLDDASAQLGEIRKQNRVALREMNRQVRVGVNSSAPNLLLIQVDRLPAAAFHGKADELSQISQLVESGRIFSRYYAASSDLATARWSLYTGRNPGVETATESRQKLPANGQSLPDLMWNGGYSTAFVGQWDDPDLPTGRGYEEWVGFRRRSAALPYPPAVSINQSEMRLIANTEGDKQGVHAIDLFSAEAIQFLKRAQQARRPFFLHVSFPQFVEGRGNEAEDRSVSERIDSAVGKLVSALRDLKMANATCIILTAESGPVGQAGVSQPETLPDGTRLFSHGLGEGNLHVPLVVNWPGMISPGTTDHLCAAWDLLPTILELTSTNRRPARSSGISFAPLLRSGKQKEHPLLYWSSPDRSAQAVRKEDWKGVVLKGDSAVRLYDLKTDPGESVDLAKQHPDVIQQLLAK